MKLTNDMLIKEICEYIATHPNCVKELWDKSDRHRIDEAELVNEEIWECDLEEAYDGVIDKHFRLNGDCMQISVAEQLKVLIVTNQDSTEVISFYIEG